MMKDLETQLEQLRQENEELRLRLQEAQETMAAIQSGEVDALVVNGPEGEQVFSLRGSDHSYRVLIEEMREGAISLAEDGSILYANKFMEKLLDMPLEKIIGVPIEQFVHPADLNAFNAALKNSQPDHSSTELKLTTGKGATLLVYLSANRISLEGVPIFCLVVTDLTEQKRHERILAEERLSRSIIDQSADAIIVCDDRGKIIRASQVSFDIAGENCLNEPFNNALEIHIKSSDREPAGQDAEFEVFSIDHVIKGKRFHSCEAFIEKDGIQSNHLLLSAVSLQDNSGQVIGAIVNLADISDKIQLEQSLKESKAWLSTTLKSIGDGVMATDKDGNVILMNPIAEQLTGWTEAEAFGKSIDEVFNIVNEETHKKVENPVVRVLRERRIVGLANHTLLIAKDGREFPIADSGAPIRDYKGDITGVVLIFRDQTRERTTQRALEESEALFRTAIDDSPIAMLVSRGVDEEVIAVNKKFTQLFGYTPRDIPDVSAWWHLAYPEESYRDQIRALWTTGIEKAMADQSHVPPVEVAVMCKDGSRKDVSVQASSIGETNLVAFLDLTERKRAEKEKEALANQLRQAQKMEAIATLTGGIAHDYNNLLAMILGNISLAREEINSEAVALDLLRGAEQAVLKTRDLTHRLMTLSKGGASTREPGSIGSLLEHSVYRTLEGSKVYGAFSIPEDLYPINHDSRQIGYVIENIVANALDAMPRGGTLFVRAENVTVEAENNTPALPLDEGKYVSISIRDEGPGIPEEIMDRIFDPYFSTKGRGTEKGMGLGMAIAYAVVRKHGGHIAVASTPGAGTTVNIYLPAFECGTRNAERGVQNKNPDSAIRNPHSAIKRILVMDDEESLRTLAQRMLEHLGYEVKTVKDGVEAIETYKTPMDSGEPFHAVILDLTIKGGMGGEQTIKELIKIDPDVKAIVCSGYFNDPVMAHYAEHGFRGAMAKPYQMADLERVLKQVFQS